MGAHTPYPNPSNGGPVNVDVNLPTAANVSCEVFTTAFRKIVGQTWPAPAGNSSYQWDLTDKTGSRAANGLYYIRIQVTGAQPLTKVYKVLISR